MDLLKLILECVRNAESPNVTIAVSINDLFDFGNYLIEKDKKAVEKVVIADKVETYPSPRQVSEILHVDLSTLWRWNKRGYLKPVEIGGKRRYKMSEVNALLNPDKKKGGVK